MRMRMSLKDNTKKYYRHFLVLVLLIILIPLSTNLSRTRSELFPVNLDRPIGLQILTQMLGEVRTILSSYLYIRADLYHHERMEKHYWARDKATLPLYRLITALDPHNENAYDFGAYHLAINFKKTDQAIDFLREGLKYNPRSFKLHFTMGDIYYTDSNFTSAITYYEKAFNLTNDLLEIKNVLRRLFWSNRKLERYKEANKYLQMWSRLDPVDPLPARFSSEMQQIMSGEKTEEDFKIHEQTEEEAQKVFRNATDHHSCKSGCKSEHHKH
jgi:tetratricopeptide (TPR) repeat protein